MVKMVKRIADRRGSFLFLSLLLGIVPFLLHPIYFMEPDDYLLNYIANGSYGSTYSAFLVYIRLPIGLFLKSLYALTTSINWYAVLVAAVLILSYAVLYRCIWERTGSLAALLVLMLPNLVTVRWFFTYTVAAFLITTAGFVLMLCEASSSKYRRVRAIGGALLAWVGVCLRDDTILPVVFLMVSLVICSLLRRGKERGQSDRSRSAMLRRMILPICVFIVLFSGTSMAERTAYAQEPWASYTAFNEARTRAVDYPSVDYNAHIERFTENGYSWIDYYMLVGWKFADKSVFTVDSMNAAGEIEAKDITLIRRIGVASEQLDAKGKFVIFFPLFIFVLMLLIYRGYPWRSGVLALLCVWALDAALLFIRMRYVLRVAIPLAITASVVLLLLAAWRTGERNRVGAVAGYLVILVAGTLFMRSYAESFENTWRAPESEAFAELKSEMDAHPERLYVMDGAVLSAVFYYDHPVTHVRTTDRFRNIVRSGSWDSFSGRYYEQAEQYIAEPDNLLTSLSHEEKMRFISYDAGLVQEFLKLHTSFDGESEITEFSDSSVKLYNFFTGAQSGQ